MSLTSIVIVNWNTRALTLACIASVRRHTRDPYELILVDNGSTDGSAEALRALAGPGTTVVHLSQNLGFAAGCNRGLAVAAGETVCLLNSDCLVTSGWLSRLRRRMVRTGAGMVGPYTNDSKRRQRRRPLLGRFPPPFRRTREVDSLSFFCVLLSRAVLDRVGALDERFGAGTFEDDDYCRRARAAGFRLFVDGRSWVWHQAHATFRANDVDHQEQQDRNRHLYQEKWADAPGN